MSAQFKIKAADPASVVRLERELGLPRFIAATLVARGIDNPAAVHRFLAPSLERDWLDPYIIPGLSDVADALEAAVKRGDHILVFGDFDLDGISATTVLTRGLRALGAQATPFIPLRFEEGYALSPTSSSRWTAASPARRRPRPWWRRVWAWLSPTTTSRWTLCLKACPWPIRSATRTAPAPSWRAWAWP